MKRKRDEPKNAGAAEPGDGDRKRARPAGSCKQNGSSPRRFCCPKCGVIVEAGGRTKTGKRNAELLVKLWEGGLPPYLLNGAIRKLMRDNDSDHGLTDAEREERWGLSRQQRHNMLHSRAKLNVPMLLLWCNEHEMEFAFMVATAARGVRQFQARQRN